MFIKGCDCLQIFSLVLIVKVLLINNRGVLSKNDEESRLETLNKAIRIRYGINTKEPDPYSAIPLFEEVSKGHKDEIALDSMYELGMIYLLGYKRLFSVRYDVSKAAEYFSKSAELGSAKSQFMMSFLLHFGVENGPEMDEEKAMSFLRVSASKGYTPAMLALAYREMSSEPAKAIKRYKKIIADKSQDFDTMVVPLEDMKISSYSLEKFKLNEMKKENDHNEYLKDSGVEEQLKQGESKLGGCKGGKAGKQEKCKDLTKETQSRLNEMEMEITPDNLVSYLYELGLMCLYGIGVPKNCEKGIKLLDRALSLGCTEAANHLGTTYFFGQFNPEEGRAIPVDYDKALKYFKISAAAHDPEGFYYLGEIVSARSLLKGPKYYHYDAPYTYKLYRLSADYGFTPGYIRCAQLLEKGLGVEMDLTRSAINYKTASEQSFIRGIFYFSFYSYIRGNHHAATVLNSIAAFCGVESGQWNAAMLIGANKCSIFKKEDFKNHLNEALLQGETDTLYYLAKLREKEGKLSMAEDLFQKGFNSGDMDCLDPLINYNSRSNLEKAKNLLEYKTYRNNILLNNGRRSLATYYYNNLSTKGSLAFLKVKQLIYNVLK